MTHYSTFIYVNSHEVTYAFVISSFTSLILSMIPPGTLCSSGLNLSRQKKLQGYHLVLS